MAFISFFGDTYKTKTGQSIMINRNAAKWASMELLESFGRKNCYDAVEWYFKIGTGRYSWEDFVKKCESLIGSREMTLRDRELRAEARLRAKRWLND